LLAPDAQQFTLVPSTIEVTSALLEEHYNVVSKARKIGNTELLDDDLVPFPGEQPRRVRGYLRPIPRC
jgi:hypothetical protein